MTQTSKPRKGIKGASAKAKGRRFQQEVRRLMIEHLGLDPADVTSRPMGSPGEDIIIGVQSRRVFPYSVETKHRKSMKEVYDAYQQAVDNCPDGVLSTTGQHVEPLYVLRTDYKPNPLVVVDLRHFLDLVAARNDQPQNGGKYGN